MSIFYLLKDLYSIINNKSGGNVENIFHNAET